MQNTSKLNKKPKGFASAIFFADLVFLLGDSNMPTHQSSREKNVWQICDHDHINIKMNLFRGRRSSTGGTASTVASGELENEDASSASLLSGARSSLCRVFLPRSRTTTSCNLASASAASTSSNSSSSQSYSSSLRLSTSSHYFEQKSVGNHASSPASAASSNESYCRRTASLSRNLTRRSRSVTMPNIEQQAHPALSTFKSSKRGMTTRLPPHNEVTNMTISKSSSLSQFGTIAGHHSGRDSKLKNGGRRDRSVDSLVNSSQQEGMQSFLEEINDNEEDEATPVAGTPDVSQDRKVANQSLDSLLEINENLNETSSTMKKSNSLPKSAFGTLQLKVAQIKAQLDTFKNDSSNAFLKTPTAPNPSDSTLHPNTPSYGYEYSLPPNLTTSGESGDNTTDSPLSSSPNRMSPFTTTTTNSSNSSIKVPPFLPLTTATTSSISSSPSTLSPASSNSLPSISRPQNLKLPQSHSLNTFPNNNKVPSGASETESELNRLIFFFDVMSTQEKIAKVCQRGNGVMR